MRSSCHTQIQVFQDLEREGEDSEGPVHVAEGAPRRRESDVTCGRNTYSATVATTRKTTDLMNRRRPSEDVPGRGTRGFLGWIEHAASVTRSTDQQTESASLPVAHPSSPRCRGTCGGWCRRVPHRLRPFQLAVGAHPSRDPVRRETRAVGRAHAVTTAAVASQAPAGQTARLRRFEQGRGSARRGRNSPGDREPGSGTTTSGRRRGRHTRTGDARSFHGCDRERRA